ncbi:MAG: hypothetical protein HYZ26_11815 [Chloroflexi bacterium]|nr:hypothetical protein [Chloroflexota bacterium]
MRSSKVRSKLFLVLGVLALVALACGTSSGGPDLAATAAALEATAAALNSQPTQPPAPPPANPPASPPTQDTSGGADSGGEIGGDDAGGDTIDYGSLVSGDVIYATDFDGTGDDWEEGWIWFTIPDNKDDFFAYVQSGFMILGLDDLETSVYLVPDFVYLPRGTDVYVEASFDNVGTTRNNNLSVGCRGTADGWYEFSISSSGLWWIYKYTPSGGFQVLNNGGLANYNKNVSLHTLGATCIGDELTFYVDGEQLRNGTIRDSAFREGQVFLSVYSANLPGVEVEIDYFYTQVP